MAGLLRVTRVVAVLSVAAALVTACGDGNNEGDGGLSAGTVDSAGCVDWNAASPEERAALVRELGYPEQTAAFPDVVGAIVESVNGYCKENPDEELGLGGAIEGAGLALPGVSPSTIPPPS